MAKKVVQDLPFTKPTSNINALTSNSMVSCDSTKSDSNKLEIIKVIADMVENTNQLESGNESKEADRHTIASEIQSDKESPNKLEEVAVTSSNPSDSLPALVRVLTEEEEYKIKLEEKRREVREKAAIEAELERERQEVIRIEMELAKKLEEEQDKLADEELDRIHRLAREQEQERLRVAMELNEKLEAERKSKEEMDRKVKEENERRVREEMERAESVRVEKIRMEDEERLERRKKIDLIMRRVNNKDNNTSAPNTNNSTTNLLISATDLTTGVKSNETNTTTTNTPILQSILSKTRITTILNKYADDPQLNNPTLSLIAQKNNQTESTRINNGDLGSIDSDPESQKSELEHINNNSAIDMNEVSVVVDENSSADSSSPSSPVSLASTTSSRQASPPNTPTENSQTQISA